MVLDLLRISSSKTVSDSFHTGANFSSHFLEKDIDRIYRNLSILPDYEVYKKSDIPLEYHYQKNVRIGGE